jgi:hypothetical protein
MNRKLLASAALAAASIAGGAHAAVIASDNLESYTLNGALNGGSGGTGWTGNWAAVPGILVETAALSGGGTKAAESNDVTDSITAATRAFAPQTGTVYFSLLFDAVAGLTTDDFIHVYLANAASNVKSGGIGLLSTTTDFLGARVGDVNGGDTTSSTTAAVQGTTYLLVGKVSKTTGGNYNRVDLFINPATTTEPVTPDATDAADSTVSTLSVFGIRTFNTDVGDRYQFDEIKVGTTFADVVPEPATAGLLTLAGATLLGRRRRRRAV